MYGISVIGVPGLYFSHNFAGTANNLRNTNSCAPISPGAPAKPFGPMTDESRNIPKAYILRAMSYGVPDFTTCST